jgi:predicted PurR-regulated permease PerM
MTIKHRTLKQTISSTIKRFNKSTASSGDKIENNEINSLLTLFGAILRIDENFNKTKFKEVITSINKEIPTKNKNEIIKLFHQKFTPSKISKVASDLSHLNLTVKELLLKSLIEIACSNNKYTKEEQEIIDIIRIEFSMSETHAYELWKKAGKKTQKNSNIISSGTALVIVVIIIIIFILAASLFLSVIFGLILAYFFLPIQYCFKNTFFPSKFATGISRIIATLLLPITYTLKIISRILPKTKKLDSEPKLSIQEQKELNLIKLSCRTTVVLVMTILLIFIIAASLFSTTYFAYATRSMTNWAKQTTKNYKTQSITQNNKPFKILYDNNSEKHNATSTNNITLEKDTTRAEPKDFLQALLIKIESFKPKLEKIPFFQSVKTNVTKYLKDPENIKKLLLFVLDKAGGVFSYTAGAIGMIFMLLMNLVLTFFFFAFFLNHMAKFNNTMDEKATAGEHIVNGILSSGWLPNTTKETKYGAIVILNNIFARLRSWVRGYLTIIIVETVFYVTTFLLVGVPYGVILGILAGLTILLPYIGTMISVLLTVTICLTIGTGGMIQVVIVLLLYTLMGGIIEQLFIYPAVVGKTLGLNEFETIVLVLLGGILAGIPGMIFAVPIASILKYLIPEVYKFWQDKKVRSSDDLCAKS